MLRASALLFVAVFFAHLFNYLFQIFMARHLAPADYGALNAALAFLGLLGLPLAPIQMMQTRAVAAVSVRQDDAVVAMNFRSYFATYALIALTAVAVGLLANGPVADYLKLPDSMAAFVLLLAFAVGLLGNSATCVLSGLQSFVALGWLHGSQGALRFAACALAVLIAPGLATVVLGLLVAAALSALVANLSIRRLWTLPVHRAAATARVSGSELLHVSLANAGFFALTQADILLVSATLGARDAGLYAAAAVIGKAALHLPAVIVLAMFPVVSASSARREDARHLLVKSLGAALSLSSCAAAIVSLFTEWVVLSFFGEKYVQTMPLLRYFGWAMVPMTALQVLKNYFIARERMFFSYVIALAAVVEVAWFYLGSPTLVGVLQLLGILGAGVVAIGLVVPFCQLRR